MTQTTPKPHLLGPLTATGVKRQVQWLSENGITRIHLKSRRTKQHGEQWFIEVVRTTQSK